jgi:hypothetical protein|tara:strand:- start:334 stop:549 length:216 start_codon:yes stop_codon:yes gene_type:complete
MGFMSEKDIENQALNLLMKELRKLDYFKCLTDSKSLFMAFHVISQKIGSSVEFVKENTDMDDSLKNLIAKH